MLGFGPIGSYPLGALPDDFAVGFDINRVHAGHSIIEIVSFVDRELIEELERCPDQLRLGLPDKT